MQNFILVFAISYLLGSMHISYVFLKRTKNADIRQVGTGNAGASNAFIHFGAKVGAITAACDISKGFLAVFLTRLIFGPSISLLAFSALAAVIGHVFPFYMEFRGGKGLATIIGATTAISVPYALLLIATLFIVTFTVNYIAIGTLSTGICSAAIFFYNYRYSWATLFYAIVMLIMLFKHIPNYVRIYKKEEMPFRETILSKIRRDA
ncbi:MAG: glycerol-3-phosphate acyltransferase [Eubacteriaceae bacterium]|jgi:glycerol-3-phosphate acyltransferase PlsY|nr:glycerol-3-phosphate acyltransferase [Eubacteriaceae bacterium]